MKTSTISRLFARAVNSLLPNLHRFPLVLLLFFVSAQLTAQPVSDANTMTEKGANTTSISIPTFSVPANDDRLLVVCAVNSVNATPPAITFGSSSMTQGLTEETGGLVVTMYYLVLGSSVSATSGAVNATGTNLYYLSATSFHNVDQSDPTDGETSTSISGTTTLSTLTVNSSPTGLVCDAFGYYANSGATDITEGMGQTLLFKRADSSPVLIRFGSSTKAGASPSVTMNWTVVGTPTAGLGSHVGMNIRGLPTCPATGSIWYVDAAATSGGNGASWACAFQNVQDAIDAASSGHEIWVKTGTYLPTKDPFGNTSPTDPRDKTFHLKDGVAVYGGFDGTETMRSQRNWVTNVTTLSGDIGTSGDDTDNAYHVVLSVSDANTTVLDGFTVTKGKASGTSSITVESFTVGRSSGGGMYHRFSSVTFGNCTFSDNSANSSGGGFYNFAGTPNLTNCTFSNNSAGDKGGGVYNSGLVNATFNTCTFANNSSQYGGGAFNTNSTITFTACTFQNNSASNSGGGMRSETSTSVTVIDGVFAGNTAGSSNGGGFYIGTSSTSAILTNCLITGNSAGSVGGGIYNSGTPTVTLTNCTITGNQSAGNGGGIYFAASNPTLTNCVSWNNRANGVPGTSSANLFLFTSTPTITYSLIQNQTPNGTGNLDGITPAAQSNYPNFVTPLDPATAPSTDGDFHVTDCSPILNAGDNSAAHATDLFGNNRPFGTTVDLGVHELQSSPTTTVAVCQNTSINLDGTGNATLTAANLNNGSTGCEPLSFSASPNTFNCTNLGANTVTLTVTGANNNTSTCMATVTVTDNLPPNALCRDFVKNLDVNGMATITPAEVNNLSTDNCGTVNLVSALPSSFNCTNIGVNNVTLTVNDGHGNQSTCVGHVTISDATPPTAICQNIGVNLGSNGTASITAAQVNYGSTDNCGIASLSVSPNSFTCSNIGNQSVTLTVTDDANLTNTCNATVTVSDANVPTALCQNISVNLGSNGTASITGAQVNNDSNDNCGIANLSVSPNSFNCSNIGGQSVTLTVTDNSNLTSTCTATVTVSDATNPNAVCQDISVNLDENGNASITGGQVDGGSTDNCGVANLSVSPNTFDINDVGPNSVTLTVTDNNALTATCTATVTVTNTNAPNAVCQPYTAVLDVNGSVTIDPADVDGGSMAIGGIASMNVSPDMLTCSDLGINTVTLTVVGNNNEQATCNATVTVQDSSAPTVVCKNILVSLSGSTVIVMPSQVFDAVNSSDNCGMVNPASVSPNTFTCNNLGANSVVLTANDGHGNSGTCNATVTVQDNTQPTVVCSNISVNLNASGIVNITPAQVFNVGSSGDNCGTVNLVNVSPNAFNCSNLGANSVTLTANDGHGNTNTCSATVTVNDNLSPNALCRDIVVQLDQNGNASITASQVNNGSTDNCDLGTLSVSPNSFTLADEGINSVTLTVPDINSNSATCMAQVTVENNQLPNAVCQNISRNLDINGEVHLTAADVDDGSSALGGIASMNVSPNLLTCSNIGSNTVTLTVIGNNEQQASCNATVMVGDATPPNVVCQNISIAWNGSANTITAADVYDAVSSSDNCGTINLVGVSPSTFTCSNLGDNTVTLTVNDGHGNETTCQATVTLTGAAPIWYADTDSDGYGDPMVSQMSCTQPTGYVSDNTDCNDMNISIYPGATELCNNLDDDCDTEIDEGVGSPTIWYADNDHDGFGDPNMTISSCTQPPGYVSDNTDCNDGNVLEHHGQIWYKDFDGDDYSDGTSQITCLRPTNYFAAIELTSTSGDCDDNNIDVHPNATEVCNGLDDDCANGIDDGLISQNYYVDGDGDGYGAGAPTYACQSPGMGYVLVDGDCEDDNMDVHPNATEVCNGVDDDCDLDIDEGAASPATWYADSDADGYGDPLVSQVSCTQPTGYVSNDTDCDDDNMNVHPNATEACNGVDDDCANGIDDGLTFNNYYLDNDGDGYGAGSPMNACQSPGANYVLVDGDCDDDNMDVHPNATEACNGVDDDCANGIDDGLVFRNYYVDGDGDGYGAGSPTYACQSPGAGYVLVNGDCDDGNMDVHPNATEVCNGIDDDCANGIDDGLISQNYYVDGDGDGYGAGAPTYACQSPGMGYVLVDGDCDDSNMDVHPNASEVCNGVDDDCDIDIDEGVGNLTIWYRDADNDGYGNPVVTLNSCTQPSGYVADNTDCNDNSILEHPGQTWYKDMDNDGYSDGMSQIACLRPSNYYASSELTATTGDCNDNNNAVNPGAMEVCNGIDDDCANGIDDGLTFNNYYLDGDGDGYGAGSPTNACQSPGANYVLVGGDCNDLDANEFPGQTWYIDADNDGFGSMSVIQCERPASGKMFLELAAGGNGTDDCDDTEMAVHPDAQEVCDNIDNNCNGLTDTDDPLLVDNTQPSVECQDISISLDNTANATISPSDVFLNGTDNCGTVNPVSVSPKYFTCGDEGANQVTLTVDDSNGNTATCIAIVTVEVFLTEPIVTVVAETCAGAADGSIHVNASAHAGQVGYSIDGGNNFSFNGGFHNLAPGTYNIVVKVFGIPNICEKTAVVTVAAGDPQSIWYKDMDADGYTDGNTLFACTQPPGYVASANPNDCNDNDPTVNVEQIWYKDADSDGYTDGTTQSSCTRPTGYKSIGELVNISDIDCDDSDIAINHAATEVCNGIDDDCDGDIDEDTTGGLTYTGNVAFYTQAAVDGFSQCYSIINGNLMISGASINDLSNLSNLIKVTGNVNIQNTGLIDMDGLDTLSEIGGTLTIYFNNLLETLSGFDSLESVGGSLFMYYNFKLPDCCAFYNLLNNNGVTGSEVIFFNKVGCNSVGEILSNCVPSNPLIGSPNAGNILSSTATKQQLTIYPNPTERWVTVSTLPLNDNCNIRLFDLSGKVVCQWKMNGNQSQMDLDLSGIHKGLYILQMNTGDDSLIEKLIIQ